MAEKKVPLDQIKKQAQGNSKRFQLNLSKNMKMVLLVAAALVVIGGAVATGILVSYIMTAPPFDPEKLATVETSYIYDKDGREIAELHDEQNRVVLPLSEIPEHVQKAVIAMEDERYYKHPGFDAIGFARAVWVNLRTRSFAQGASTLTQQLTQNAFLGPEKRIKRKVQEIWLALQMERHFSKEEILEMYLNRVFFGGRVYGVEAASQTYFNKSVRDINIAEAAMLAGILRWPNQYNPLVCEADALSRMKLALGNMLRLGYIDQAEYEAALAYEFKYGEPPSLEYPNPYFVDYVVHHELIDILEEIFGSRDDAYEAIYSGGLRVYTTMDTAIQNHAEDVLNRAELYPRTIYIDMAKAREAISSLPPDTKQIPSSVMETLIDEETGIPQPQSALVLADPATGEVWALVGGREYGKKKNELLRFLSERQPGSAIKPVIAYGPAIEEGKLGAGSALDDAPLIGPGGWYPENYDGTFQGLLTARTALARSLNLPAVRTYQMVGLQTGAEYARKLGISTFDPSEAVPSWALGSREVTAWDMAQAYSVFANDGIKMELHTVRRIEDRAGNVIYEHSASPEQVLTPQTTFILNSILQDVVRYTTARGLGNPRPLAAKTGTTDNERDVYLAAYAPNVVATFWMGYDEKTLGQISRGWNYTTTIVREVFDELFKTLPVAQFKSQPSGVVRVEVCSKSGLLPSEHCREAETVVADYFLANHVPRLECDMHVELDICKVSGKLAGEFCPEDEVKTEYFFNRPDYITTDGRWERGAGRKPADASEKAPTEMCDVHTEHSWVITSFEARATAPDRIELKWNYSGSALKEFQLKRQNGGEEKIFSEINKNKREFTDKEVSPATWYTYTLIAVGKDDQVSDPATATALTLPTAPHLHELSVVGGEIVLNWEQVPGVIEGYSIERKKEGGNFDPLVDVGGDKTSHADSDNLESGATYTYRLRAYNSSGPSEYSNERKQTFNGSSGGEEGSTTGNGGLWAFIRRYLPRVSLFLTQ